MAKTTISSGNNKEPGLADASKPDNKTQPEEVTSESVNQWGGALDTKNHSDPEAVLRDWRTKILNGFLVIVAVAAAVMTAASILDAISRPGQWPAVILFFVMELVLIVLAIFQRIDYRIRAWGVLLVPYAVGVTALASFGLGSSGRLYLLALPIGALILMGVRSGIIMSVLSILTMVVFAFLAERGVLLQWLVNDRNSLLLADWLAEFVDTAMLLAVVMALLIMFYRFQERLIEKERRTQADLLHAQVLLEQQNVTLEQKIQERTGELQASNLSLEQRASELTIINRVQEALASNLDIEAIYELIGEKVREVFNVLVVDIVTYDPDTNLISMPYSYEKGDRSVISPRTPYGFRQHIINSCTPLLINQNFADLAAQYNNPLITGEWPKSALFVPLLVAGTVKSIISIQDLERENAFSDSDVRLLQTLANSMSIALENARLFDETQRLLKETEQRAAELAIINSIQQGLASQLDMQGIYDLVGDKVREIFDANTVTLATFDLDKNLMHPRFALEKGQRFFIEPIPIPEVWMDFIRRGQPTLINNNLAVYVQRIDPNAKPLAGEMPKSVLAVPLMMSGQVRGVVSLQNIIRENAFSESDMRLLQTLANSMSIALENARLFDETQRLLKETEQRAAELATVNTVSSALASELDLTALIHLVGEQMRSIFDADIAYVALLDEASGMINFPYTYGEELTPIQYGDGLTSRIIETNMPLLINQELNRQTVEIGATVVGRQSLSYLGVPVNVGGKAVGVVSVQSITQEGLFTENDQHLLSTIAANVGIALQNARLFDEIKHQEQNAQETRRRLADIINFLPDATLVINHEGQVVAWNHAIEEMTGVTSKEIVGKGNYEYALPFYGERRPILIDLVLLPREEIEKKYAHIQWTGEILTGEAYTPALKDGARYLYATASALHDAQGNIVGAIEIIRDITDRKHTEEELKKARAAAEQANHAKSAFLANMSHELRTPLNSIIGFTRIVRRKAEGALPEKQTENLDKVLTSADHLLNLINTVLDIAKIEAGRMDVLAANFRISALIDLCFNTAQPLIKPTATLEKQVDENLNIVYSDQDKIRQIVLNLLSNAAKFTPTGKIILAAKQDGDNLRISVSDTGIGISAEALPRIFKEFQQADNTTTRQYGGTGLGLSISRNLARLLGGDITIESELGKGSTFTLVIPIRYRSKSLHPSDDSLRLSSDREPSPALPGTVRQDRCAPGAHLPREQVPGSVDQTQGKPAPVQVTVPQPEPGSTKKRILVIDDDPDAVYILQENLNQQEFEIIGRLNGQDGLRAAREEQPQAILLDIVMPGTDGWQVLHDLKADPSTSNIPVVLHTIVDNKALGFQLGAAAYLLKPLDAVEVRDALHHVIGSNIRLPKHVLVVDDDPNVVDMLRQSLPESDFSLESALDGEAGLRAIEAKRPDIVLLDLIMPHLDGFGVIESLRANPQTRDLPIIVISAKELTAAEIARLKETVSLVMKKQGFEGEKLVDEINNVLKQERMSA